MTRYLMPLVQISIVLFIATIGMPQFAPASQAVASRKIIKAVYVPSADHYAGIVAYEKYRNQMKAADFKIEQYEGMESSPNIIYTGAAPNQQIIPAVRWSFKNMKRRFYLVGSDYIFPRAANEIIKSEAARLGAQIVGEVYIKLGETQTGQLIEQIIKTKKEFLHTLYRSYDGHWEKID